MLRTLCMLLLVMPSAPGSIMAQSVRVLVLDAKSGKPQAGVEVYYFCSSPFLHRNFLPPDSDITNSQGLAIIDLACHEEDSVDFFVTALPKEECGGEIYVTVKDTLSAGIISQPDAAGEMHCPTKISRKLKPVPGEVVIFIKKPNWVQYHFGV
jgi:hypothetical protein